MTEIEQKELMQRAVAMTAEEWSVALKCVPSNLMVDELDRRLRMLDGVACNINALVEYIK